MNLSREAQQFLWYSYFTVSYDELAKDHEAALLLCAQRAYLDMNRTLTFDSDKEDHKGFRNSVCGEIIGGIRTKLLSCDQSAFDSNHSQLCNHIIKFVKDKNILIPRKGNHESFHYGQAQKWLNMTLKYMLIMGFWPDELKPIETVIHIPVDNFIMKAASNMGVMLPRTNGTYGKYSASSKLWSKWSEEEYIRFQTHLRESIKQVSPHESPIEWECHAWIEAHKDEIYNREE